MAVRTLLVVAALAIVGCAHGTTRPTGVDCTNGRECLSWGMVFFRGSAPDPRATPADLRRAAGYLEAACEDGFHKGCLLAGNLHRLGAGVPRDLNRAASWYGLACSSDDETPEPCRNLREVRAELSGETVPPSAAETDASVRSSPASTCAPRLEPRLAHVRGELGSISATMRTGLAADLLVRECERELPAGIREALTQYAEGDPQQRPVVGLRAVERESAAWNAACRAGASAFTRASGEESREGRQRAVYRACSIEGAGWATEDEFARAAASPVLAAMVSAWLDERNVPDATSRWLARAIAGIE